MRTVKTKWPHYFIEMPADIDAETLRRFLTEASKRNEFGKWTLKWNNKLGMIEFFVKPKRPHRTVQPVGEPISWDEIDIPL